MGVQLTDVTISMESEIPYIKDAFDGGKTWVDYLTMVNKLKSVLGAGYAPYVNSKCYTDANMINTYILSVLRTIAQAEIPSKDSYQFRYLTSTTGIQDGFNIIESNE